MKVIPNDNVVLNLALDHEGKRERESEVIHRDPRPLILRSHSSHFFFILFLLSSDCVYRAQRWIKGTVTLETKHESLLCKNGSISISLIGKEQTWTTPSILDACLGRENDQAVLFEEEQVLHEFYKQEEEPNFTTFPFSIFLPGSLAPSMYLEDGPRGCSVSYELTAWCGTHVSVSRPVHIIGPTLSTKTHPYHLAPFQLSSEKDFLLAIQMENTHVAKGRSLEVALSFRNRSSSTIVELKQFNVQVMESIHWKTRTSQQHSYTHILSEQRNVTLPSIHALPEDMDDESMQLEMEYDLSSPNRESHISIPIPSTARDSYPGTKRIQVTHALCIRMVTLTTNPEVTHHDIPLVLCDPPLHHHRHTASKESLKEIMTTVWPGDVVPPCENTNNHDSSEHSFPSIMEEGE